MEGDSDSGYMRRESFVFAPPLFSRGGREGLVVAILLLRFGLFFNCMTRQRPV